MKARITSSPTLDRASLTTSATFDVKAAGVAGAASAG
jgi:hypothetical protein